MATIDKPSGLHRAIWAIALPSMLTNVATALFGLADLWVIGQLGDANAQAGVEIGAKFMMGLLVIFNFLRKPLRHFGDDLPGVRRKAFAQRCCVSLGGAHQ